MSLPEFTAELSLSKSTRVYRARASYGSVAHGNSASPANVFPSQFDGSEELGDLDATGLEADAGEYAGEEDADLEENGEGDFDGLEDGEESDMAGEDEGDDEGGLG
jgi:hypothetical protein